MSEEERDYRARADEDEVEGHAFIRRGEAEAPEGQGEWSESDAEPSEGKDERDRWF